MEQRLLRYIDQKLEDLAELQDARDQEREARFLAAVHDVERRFVILVSTVALGGLGIGVTILIRLL